VQDVTHDQHVGARQLVGEEVARVEAQPLAEPGRRDVLVEEGAYRRQVEASPADVLVGERDLYRDATLRTSDVDHRLVALPREGGGDRPRRARAETAHRLEEAAQPGRLGIERLEEVAPRLGLVLRHAGAQSLGERVPEPEEARVHHLEDPPEVGRLAAIEEQIGGGGVRVLAALALEHPQRHERVEEVARAALVQA
jgi:hypothetical protein